MPAGVSGRGSTNVPPYRPRRASTSPSVLQYLQHLAQRDPADPHPLGQLALGRKPFAARHQAQPDHLEDLFERLLETVARPHLPQYGIQPRDRAALARRVGHLGSSPSQAMVLFNTLGPLGSPKERFQW